jgi:acetylornithine deacetylase
MTQTENLTSTIEILTRLVAFDTTSRNSNLPLIEWVEAHVAPLQPHLRRVPNSDGTKTNLIISFGPLDAPGGVVLSGHTDVVPVDGQDWSTNPWVLTERDGRLYGRGTCDMKGFAACALAFAPAMAKASLIAPIHIALSYDEEIGCLGAPSLVEVLNQHYAKPEAVIIGEPSDMGVVSGQKGLSTFQIEITGRAAHSSQVQQGVSAIMEAVPLLTNLRALAEEVRSNAPKDSPFEPPGTSLTIGLIDGGTASNILAQSCNITWDMRFEVGDDPHVHEARVAAWVAEVDASIKARAPEGGAHMMRRSLSPAMAPETQGAAEALARALTGDNTTRAVAYATEGGIFQGGGLSTVICGPGSILQAHQPDEFIEISQLAAGCAFMERLVKRLSASQST